jgi:glycosyltransferase involved in cell wall biosynthesis
MRDYLMVNFPVDLGNRTIESNFREIFKNDMDFFSFAEEHKFHKGQSSLLKSIYYRFKSSLSLRREIESYRSNQRKILLNSISPALFSYGKWDPDKTALVLDWTRSLYPFVTNESIKKDFAYTLHRKVLHKAKMILCWTDDLMKNLHEIYGVDQKVMFKVPPPFLVSAMSAEPRPTPEKVRVLFVGGDLNRKGGDIILREFLEGNLGNIELSFMTNAKEANIPGANFYPGIKYGSQEHRDIFLSHDILLLPTRKDSLPQVIAEAASCGLAVITTRFALAAKDVITHGKSGFIADHPEDCIGFLKELSSDQKRIDAFKWESYNHMHQQYSIEKIRESYLEVLKSLN